MSQRLEELTKALFATLDRVEMSSDGHEFHPVSIHCSRIMDHVNLDTILGEMRFGLGLGPKPKLRARSEIEKGICPDCNGTGDPSNHEREWRVCETCVGSGRIDDK